MKSTQTVCEAICARTDEDFQLVHESRARFRLAVERLNVLVAVQIVLVCRLPLNPSAKRCTTSAEKTQLSGLRHIKREFTPFVPFFLREQHRLVASQHNHVAASLKSVSKPRDRARTGR